MIKRSLFIILIFGSFNINAMCGSHEAFSYFRKLEQGINTINKQTKPRLYKRVVNEYNQAVNSYNLHAGLIGCPPYKKG